METNAETEGNSLLKIIETYTQEKETLTTLAEKIGVSYQVVYQCVRFLRGKSVTKPSVYTLLRLAKHISPHLDQEWTDLFKNWCIEIRDEKFSKKAISRLEEKIAEKDARRRSKTERVVSADRPKYTVSGPGMPGSFECIYSVQDEDLDISKIEEARKSGTGHESANYLYSHMKLTDAAHRIGFTEEEACRMELIFHLNKMETTKSRHDLLHSCAFVCKSALPDHPICKEARGGRYSGWLFHRPDDEKEKFLGVPRDEIVKKFRAACIRIAQQYLQELRESYEQQNCSSTGEEIELLVTLSQKGWIEVGITPAELMTMRQKSVLLEARRLIQEMREKQTCEAISHVLEMFKRWGFTWTDVNSTPEEIAKLIAKGLITESLQGYKDTGISQTPELVGELEKIRAVF